MGNSKSTRVAPSGSSKGVEPTGVVPSVAGGVVITVGRSEHKTGTALATTLIDQSEDLMRCLQDAARAAGAAQPQQLPALPEALAQQVNEWAVASETEAHESEMGKQAYSFSVPMLVASQLGQTEKAQELLNEMETSLKKEMSSSKIPVSTYAWMLGRLLVANFQLGQKEEVARVGELLRGALDQILAKRVAKKPDSLEVVSDPQEAWAWAYLLCYGDKESSDFQYWLKASRMVWNSVEYAGTAADKLPHGDRMWINTMALLAFSGQMDAECIRASADPFARQSVAETINDILSLFRLNPETIPAAKGSLDPDLVEQNQLPLADAARQIPLGDFRAWAVGLARLAAVQAGQQVELNEVFLEAMKSAAPGDLALGAVTWAYAMYVAEWKRVASSE